jgi:plastocyanin
MIGMRMLVSIAAAVTVGVLAFGGTSSAAFKRLTGTDGPGFTITMSAKSVKPGRYVITIHDRSAIHNFHLTGPGVSRKTSVAAVRTYVWTVTLKRGTYRFVCDPHATIMKGVLRVT